MKLHSFSTVTRVLIKLNISANQTTLLSCIVGLCGVCLLFTGLKVLAVLILYFYIVLDYSDGWIARYNRTDSKFGAKLDYLNHTLVISAMLIVSSLVSGYIHIGCLSLFFFLISVVRPYHETGLLNNSYTKIRSIGVQLLPESGMYLGIILNRLEILIFAHLLLYFSVFVLSMLATSKVMKR